MNRYAKSAIILLLKGILYKKEHEREFFELINSIGVISDYLENIGLQVIIDESDGYAYIKNIEYEDEEEALPKLISSRELNFKVSLMCVLLREKIAEFEMQSDNEIAVVSKDELIEKMSLFIGNEFNEIKSKKEIEATLKKVEELGFLKKIKGRDDIYEIRAALKAFVDAQWLNEFDKRLKEYKDKIER